MKLNDTVAMMNSADFKDRMRAEYHQLVNRAEGLESMLKNYKEGKLKFKPKCTYELLYEQLIYMRQYQRVLECRAEIEEFGGGLYQKVKSVEDNLPNAGRREINRGCICNNYGDCCWRNCRRFCSEITGKHSKRLRKGMK